MFAETMPASIYHSYRVRMDCVLNIPLTASGQDIHQRIEKGFPAPAVKMLFDTGTIDRITRDRIVPFRTFKRRLANDQLLTLTESNRLFRVVHIIAMAEALFGDPTKAKRWLKKPKQCLSGKSPASMFFTTAGAHQVGQMLVRIGDGFSF
jgi:putative toxin-antitoxin system antitoxin component (TIGR02293 family)